MLVLLLIPIITIREVHATSYIASSDTIMSSNYHDFFLNYFGENIDFQYFSYDCGDRTCYYGIDKDFNYVNITYDTTTGYGYNTTIKTGIDENFSVTGDIIFTHYGYSNAYIYYLLIFIFVFAVCYLFVGGVKHEYGKERVIKKIMRGNKNDKQNN